MTSLWSKINSFSLRQNRRTSSWPSSNASSSFGTIFVNTYLLSSNKFRKLETPDVCVSHPSWFRGNMTRESAMTYLSGLKIGSFLVRSSSSQPGCYALSVRVPAFKNRTGISHYLITRTAQGTFQIKGLDKEWSSLNSLVVHHSVMKEMLPCTLRLLEEKDDQSDYDEQKQEEDGQMVEGEDEESSDEDNTRNHFAAVTPRRF